MRKNRLGERLFLTIEGHDDVHEGFDFIPFMVEPRPVLNE